MNNRYVWIALVLVAIVYLSFFINFSYHLNYKISNDSTQWGQFGDYVGGLLNPVLSFISMVLLIQSLNIQTQTNEKTIEELKLTKKIEKQRAFESLFFNLIESQRGLFATFKIQPIQQETVSAALLLGTEAVLYIEDEIYEMRQKNSSDQEIKAFIEKLDENEKIYGFIRAFYISVKLINDKLSNLEEFQPEDRSSYFLSLINLTDFTQLRLVTLGVQFFDYPSCKYLRNDLEFNSVLNSVGLRYDLY